MNYISISLLKKIRESLPPPPQESSLKGREGGVGGELRKLKPGSSSGAAPNLLRLLQGCPSGCGWASAVVLTEATERLKGGVKARPQGQQGQKL